MPYLLIFMCLLDAIRLSAKDHGVHGHVFPIEEEDLIEHLEKQLQCSDNQSLLQKQQHIQSRYKQSLLTPEPVSGLKEAIAFQTHYFDPTIITKEAINDNKGKIIIPKRTSYNPLKHVSLFQDLIFFDGNQTTHVEWAKSLGNQTKWILVNGRPLALEEQENRPIYFDQFGILCSKFNIRTIPTKVSQEGLRLKIESFPIQEEICAK